MPRYGTPSVKTFGSVFKLSRPDIPSGFFSNAERFFVFIHRRPQLIENSRIPKKDRSTAVIRKREASEIAASAIQRKISRAESSCTVRF
nr:MAG TPA: hypothetical protein [Caudoviricetes sp.]DAY05660.1 MAG TPA: hypothetical protein [Caudoviricetes sp.]